MPDANTIAIGAPFNSGNNTLSGHTRIYKWNGLNWTQKGGDIDGESTNNESGISVFMTDSNNIVIGAAHNDGNGASSGHARVFRWTGNLWIQKGNDLDGEFTGDNSGTSVCMADANTVAIGAPENSGSGNSSGQVRVYHSLCFNSFASISVAACDGYGSPSGNYFWTSGGIYSDTVPNATGCDSIITINLTIITSPLVTLSYNGSTYFCQGDSLELSANSGMSSWQWYRGANALPGATGSSFTARRTGNYSCVAADQNGCSGTSNSVYIYVPCVPLDPHSSGDKLSIHLNDPFLQIIPDHTSDNILINSSGGSLFIYDISGKELLSTEITQGWTALGTTAILPGIYIVVLVTLNQRVMRERIFLEAIH
jgi:hypothetical protein